MRLYKVSIDWANLEVPGAYFESFSDAEQWLASKVPLTAGNMEEVESIIGPRRWRCDITPRGVSEACGSYAWIEEIYAYEP